MSTTEQTQQGIPTGTWQADTVHSSVALRGPLRGRDVHRRGHRLRGEPRRRQARRLGQDREHQGQGREPRRRTCSPPSSSTPSGTPSSASPAATSSATATRSRSTARSRSRASRSRRRSRHDRRPDRRPLRRDPRRARSSRRRVDRTKFDMNWNMPLPNGEPALAQRGHPQGRADSGGAGGVDDARPRDQRLAPRRGSNNTALLRALREEAPEGVEVELWDGPEGDPAVRPGRRRRPGPGAGRGVPRRSFARPTRSSSQRRSTTRPSRARSRTRSTGPRARSRRTRSATSRSP